jgi:uncharacterized membrane protein YhhN
MAPVLAFQLLTVVMLAALLAAERLGSQPGKWVCKPAASAGFLGAAWTAGAWQSPYGRLVLLALALCWLGDVLLIPTQNQRAFRAGIGSFLLGQAGFAVAFAVRGASAMHVLVSLVVLALPAAGVAGWLRPNLPPGMRFPVYAYVVVISFMVALAAATHLHRSAPLLLLGAVMFYLSDISVARDRFVAPSFINRLWGLPAYYGAQLLLAATATGA